MPIFFPEWTTKFFFFLYETVARSAFQVPSGNGFEEADQVPKKFICGHAKLFIGYFTFLKISVHCRETASGN